MSEDKYRKAIEEARQALRLGGYSKQCKVCGERDPRCLSEHHLERRGYGETLVTLCLNDHARVTDPKDNLKPSDDPALLEKIGHWLIGFAEFVLLWALQAIEFGKVLIEAAKVCPRPYGYRPKDGSE